MPSDYAFRLSTSLTLGLSCLCLGYAEWDLLPEVTGFTAAVIVLLGLSFAFEGRWVLDLRQANRMGFAIGVVALLWVGFQFVRPSGGLIYLLPWPASLLPYLGPLLMVLMPAKLFRPKHAGDWWAMHGIALVAVALACAITDDEWFATLLALYAASGVVSVAMFFARWNAGLIAAPPSETPAPPPTVVAPPGRRRPAARSLREAATWSAAALAFALPLFFLSPPSPGAKWQLTTKGAMETGLTGETVVDLDRTGTVNSNRDVAVELTVSRPDGEPHDNVDAVLQTRFRAGAYLRYENGKWSQDRNAKLFWVRASADPVLPRLGPRSATFEFRPTAQLSRPVTAEPFYYRAGEPTSVVSVSSTGYLSWGHLAEGSVTPLNVPFASGRSQRYRQVVELGEGDPDLGPGYELLQDDSVDAAEQAVSLLTRVNTERVIVWAQERLDRLVREGKLPAAVLERAARDNWTLRRTIAKEDYLLVGRAFRDLFAHGSEFQYTLTLGRVDRNLDAIEDFLLNTRTGHCERFAAALALALRSVGVPAAFVLGYSHCEHDPERPDRYVIRQDATHAWVDILIARPTPADFPALPPTATFGGARPAELWHWYALDPTPQAEASQEARPGVAGWIEAARWKSAAFYNDYIVGYNAERRKALVGTARGHFRENRGVYAILAASVVGLALGGLLVRRLGPVSAAAAPTPGVRETEPPPWYGDLLAAQEAAGVPARPDWTPRELAAALAPLLLVRPDSDATLAALGRSVEGLHRLRYRGDTLTPAEADALAADAHRVAVVLRSASEPDRGDSSP